MCFAFYILHFTFYILHFTLYKKIKPINKNKTHKHYSVHIANAVFLSLFGFIHTLRLPGQQ